MNPTKIHKPPLGNNSWHGDLYPKLRTKTEIRPPVDDKIHIIEGVNSQANSIPPFEGNVVVTDWQGEEEIESNKETEIEKKLSQSYFCVTMEGAVTIRRISVILLLLSIVQLGLCSAIYNAYSVGTQHTHIGNFLMAVVLFISSVFGLCSARRWTIIVSCLLSIIGVLVGINNYAADSKLSIYLSQPESICTNSRGNSFSGPRANDGAFRSYVQNVCVLRDSFQCTCTFGAVVSSSPTPSPTLRPTMLPPTAPPTAQVTTLTPTLGPASPTPAPSLYPSISAAPTQSISQSPTLDTTPICMYLSSDFSDCSLFYDDFLPLLKSATSFQILSPAAAIALILGTLFSLFNPCIQRIDCRAKKSPESATTKQTQEELEQPVTMVRCTTPHCNDTVTLVRMYRGQTMTYCWTCAAPYPLEPESMGDTEVQELDVEDTETKKEVVDTAVSPNDTTAIAVAQSDNDELRGPAQGSDESLWGHVSSWSAWVPLSLPANFDIFNSLDSGLSGSNSNSAGQVGEGEEDSEIDKHLFEGAHASRLRSYVGKGIILQMFSSRGPKTVVLSFVGKAEIRWELLADVKELGNKTYRLSLNNLKNVRVGKSTRNFASDFAEHVEDDFAFSLEFPPTTVAGKTRSVTLDMVVYLPPMYYQLKRSIENYGGVNVSSTVGMLTGENANDKDEPQMIKLTPALLDMLNNLSKSVMEYKAEFDLLSPVSILKIDPEDMGRGETAAKHIFGIIQKMQANLHEIHVKRQEINDKDLEIDHLVSPPADQVGKSKVQSKETKFAIRALKEQKANLEKEFPEFERVRLVENSNLIMVDIQMLVHILDCLYEKSRLQRDMMVRGFREMYRSLKGLGPEDADLEEYDAMVESMQPLSASPLPAYEEVPMAEAASIPIDFDAGATEQYDVSADARAWVDAGADDTPRK